jgi:hypothetical protein
MATFVELAHEGKSSNDLFHGLCEELTKKDEKAP